MILAWERLGQLTGDTSIKHVDHCLPGFGLSACPNIVRICPLYSLGSQLSIHSRITGGISCSIELDGPNSTVSRSICCKQDDSRDALHGNSEIRLNEEFRIATFDTER